ncbi:MAG: PEGA domain-containing protein [Nitrospira sp.]|nr:PEGA domain-containing protein [Nitrospira sp.]
MPVTVRAVGMGPRALVAFLIVSHLTVTGCSIFGGSTQPLSINSDPPGANVLINGTVVGTTPLQQQVSRRGDLTVDVQKSGYQSQRRSTSRKLSSLGFVDVIGGAFLLLPLLGLIAPGAWEQDPSTFGLTLEPESNPPVPTP